MSADDFDAASHEYEQELRTEAARLVRVCGLSPDVALREAASNLVGRAISKNGNPDPNPWDGSWIL